MIQLVLRTTVAAARQTPSVIKNAMVVLRLVMRIGDEKRIAPLKSGCGCHYQPPGVSY
jgi:hypothetical protein